ncbi:MAG: ATP synthase F1 subunit epsilon [Eubacteriales bacterium]|nr:ATP synthase F1 subunit epsilon [Eubacteriales bacterium]
MAVDETIRLEIVTPYDLIYDGHVDMVVVTAADGEIGILPGHTAMFAALKDGEIRFRIDEDWQILSSSIGYAEISPDLTIIVVNSAEWLDKIDIARAEKSLERARNRLADPQTSILERRRSNNSVARATNRIKVATRYGKERKQHPEL